MPKNKKNPVTGYAIFVKETRTKFEKAGQYFPRKNQEAFLFVGPMWKKLSEDEKKRYNDMAKDEKRQGASDLESKFNALGVSFAELEAEKREKSEFLDIMMNTIQNTVRDSDFNTTFLTQKFYLCHVNYFYSNNSNRFKPAEIALCEFNLKRGVLGTFQAFINPGSIETGYRFEAKMRLEETHQIPIEDPSWTCGERDYVKLLTQIKSFLTKDNPNGRIPPIYTMPDDEKNNCSISAVRSTIETLCEACNEEPTIFRIYELPWLYHELRFKAVSESPLKGGPAEAKYLSHSMASHDLERDKFSYTKGIACQFHEEKDLGNFCSLSVVTRLVFSVCDYLLNYIPIDVPVAGGHAPKNSIKCSEVYHKKKTSEEFYDDGDDDDDGFQVVALRRPNIKQTARSGIRPISQGMQPPPFRPAAPQIQTASGPSMLMGNPRFQPPPHSSKSYQDMIYSSDDDDEIEPSSSTYTDAGSSSLTTNLSQNTVISGYTASASLSQSSFASEVSAEALPYIGRGRGIPRSKATPSSVNWAINAGRGSLLRRQQS